MGVSFKQKGDFNNTYKFLNNAVDVLKHVDLDQYGRMGVDALSSATPKDTGLASKSWYYNIFRSKESVSINFYNSDIENGAPVAILIQYGHATKNGGWVSGIDYINPALRPIFNEIAEKVWKEVISS